MTTEAMDELVRMLRTLVEREVGAPSSEWRNWAEDDRIAGEISDALRAVVREEVRATLADILTAVK